MKKIILLTILAFLSMHGYGQGIRYADLAVKFVYPQQKITVVMPHMLTYHLRVYNNGLDSLFPNDSFRYSLGHYFTAEKKLVRGVIGRYVAPGDSLTYIDSINIDGSHDYSNFTIRFDRSYGAWSANGVYPTRPLRQEYWEDSHDNLDQLRLNLKLASVNIQLLKGDVFRIFPNPVERMETIQLVSDEAIIDASIYDQSGKLIGHGEPNSEGGFWLIHPSFIQSGIYFVKVTTQNGYAVRKLVIL
jgi:hypothetical protein